jgi:uncharacterized protein involved in exopolysaccharide biosynthesis
VKTDRRSLAISRLDPDGRQPEVVGMETAWDRLVRPLRPALWIAVVAGLLAASIASTISLTRPATYRSQATLLIDEPGKVGSSQDQGVLLKLATLRAKYAALADTSPIVDPAAQESGLPSSTVAGDGQLIVAQDALTMQAQGLSPDPAVARTVAQSLGDSLSRYVASEQASLNVATTDKVTLSVIQPAQPAVRISPSVRQSVTVIAVSAIASGIIVYVIAQLALTRPRFT